MSGVHRHHLLFASTAILLILGCWLGNRRTARPTVHARQAALSQRIPVLFGGNGNGSGVWHAATLPELDEFGDPSDMLSLLALVDYLVAEGHLLNPSVANFGARDGRGSMGNTDPTWPLFKDRRFHGVAIEAFPVHAKELANNMQGLKGVNVLSAAATVGNAVQMAGPRADIIKMDIDGWDCEVLGALVKSRDALGTSVILAEYNVKYPPPASMAPTDTTPLQLAGKLSKAFKDGLFPAAANIVTFINTAMSTADCKKEGQFPRPANDISTVSTGFGLFSMPTMFPPTAHTSASATSEA